MVDAGELYEYRDYVWDEGARRQVQTVCRKRVCMVVRAPKGQAVIFHPTDVCDSYYGTYIPQSQAVKAFMEQHTS